MLVVISLVSAGIPFLIPADSLAVKLTIASVIALVGVSAAIGLVVLRQNQLRQAVLLAVGGLELALTVILIGTGIEQSGALLFAYALPIVLAGILLEARSVVIVTGLSIVGVVLALILDLADAPIVGMLAGESVNIVGAVVGFTVLAIGVAFCAFRFGHELRQALRDALEREHQLGLLSSSLERRVEERTTELQAALSSLETRSAEQQTLLAEIDSQRVVIDQLSVPALPVGNHFYVLPLIGALDATRLSLMQERALAVATRADAHHIILDVSGVPVIDSHVARGLIDTVAAVKLVGVKTTLVGLRPEVAQTLVSLGIDLGELRTVVDVESALYRR